MAEQEAEVNKRIIELSTDMQNLGSLKIIAEANEDSTVADELKIQAESLRAVVASLSKIAGLSTSSYRAAMMIGLVWKTLLGVVKVTYGIGY
jgi:hypothetical protein